MLATARPELLTRRTGWGGGKVNSATILLSRLSDVESATLLHALVGRSALDADVQATLLERAGGNPLYTEEFARMVADRPGEVALPESVQGMIAARLDVLPREEKELLQDGAVMGRVFWAGALRRDRSILEQGLRSLERKEFVRRERHPSVAGEMEYAFRHTLVREVAYEQIPREQRADKHRAAAEWIESLGRPEDHAEMLAHHYMRSLELRRAAGLPAGDDDVRAHAALREAGDRAFALNAYRAAVRYYTEALTLSQADDPDRPELMFRLARARHVTGDRLREQALKEARDALLAAGGTERVAEAETLLAEACWYRGDRAACDRHLGRAGTLVGELPPSPAKAHVLSQLARYHMLAGDHREAIDLGQQALVMAERFGLDELRAHALNSIGTAKSFMSGDAAGIIDLEASIEIALAIRSPEAARALNNLGVLLWGRGELRRSREMIDEAVRLAEEFGHVSVWRHSRSQQICQLIDRGDWETGLREADEFIVPGEQSAVDSMLRRRARIRLGRGDVAGALDDLRTALESARAMKDPQAVIPTLGSAIRLYVEAGVPNEARALAEEFVQGFPAGSNDWMLVDFAWAATSIDCGRELRQLLDDLPSAGPYGEVERALLDGDYERAANIFHEIGEAENEAAARLRPRRSSSPLADKATRWVASRCARVLPIGRRDSIYQRRRGAPRDAGLSVIGGDLRSGSDGARSRTLHLTRSTFGPECDERCEIESSGARRDNPGRDGLLTVRSRAPHRRALLPCLRSADRAVPS